MIFLQTGEREGYSLRSCNFSYVMYIFTRHGHRHDEGDLIEYPWSVLKLSVSLIRGEFNNASARRALVDWYLSLCIMCKA